MTGNMNITNHDSSDLLLGNNEFETNVITLAAGASVAEGDMLKRDAATLKFAKVTDTTTETPVAIATAAASNMAAAAADTPCRPVISGKVRAGKVTVNSVIATLAQLDMIRRSGIIPLAVTDLSKKDNQ
jgi:hypothetical protein